MNDPIMWYTATLNLNTILGSVVGPVFITTSYAASRVNRLRRPDQVVDCDLGQYANILQQYEVSHLILPLTLVFN